MFTTGEFTKIARVTRRTLRHYREIGLFEPSESGTESGYHYYTMKQIPRLHRILALRDLGFSLSQIKRVVDEPSDSGKMRGMLQLRKAEIEQNLLEEQVRVRSIESRLQLLEKGMTEYEVILTSVAAHAYFSAMFTCESQEHSLDVLGRVAREVPGMIGDTNRGPLVTRMHCDAYEPVGSEIEIGFVVEDPSVMKPATLAGLEFELRTLPPIRTAATDRYDRKPGSLAPWHGGHRPMD